MKHTIKLLTLAAILTAVFGLTGCLGPVNNYIEPEYVITVNVTNGTALYPTTAKAGDSVTITATADEGYVLDNANSAFSIPDYSVTNNGTVITWNLVMPASDVTINVVFKDNTTVDDSNSDGEDENPTDEGNDDTESGDGDTDTETSNGNGEDETTTEPQPEDNDPVFIQYDDAGGYDGELPDGVDNIKHFQYEDGYKIELNVCTLVEYEAVEDKEDITWNTLYFSFPINADYIIIDDTVSFVYAEYLLERKGYRNFNIEKYGAEKDCSASPYNEEEGFDIVLPSSEAILERLVYYIVIK